MLIFQKVRKTERGYQPYSSPLLRQQLESFHLPSPSLSLCLLFQITVVHLAHHTFLCCASLHHYSLNGHILVFCLLHHFFPLVSQTQTYFFVIKKKKTKNLPYLFVSNRVNMYCQVKKKAKLRRKCLWNVTRLLEGRHSLWLELVLIFETPLVRKGYTRPAVKLLCSF